MKLKYYLRGLGIGIICTAIIMGIALSGNKKETMTDTEILERARLLGMVMPEEKDGASESEDGQQPGDEALEPEEMEEGDPKGNVDSKKQGDNQTADMKDASKTDNSQADSGEPKSDADKDSADKAKANSQEQNQAGEAAKQPGDSTAADNSKGSVQIEIKAGEYSDTVSQKLFQAGLISDATEFNQYLTQKGADQSLRVGVYQIPVGATNDEIIEILQK